MASLSPLRGGQLDLFRQRAPAFGIPVVGTALNYLQDITQLPPALLAYLIPSITPPGSPAEQVGQQQGILESWNQRTDIPTAVKLGAELASAQVVPPFATVGPMAGTTRVMTSPAVAVVKAGEAAVPKLPVVGKLFRISAAGQVAKAGEDVGAQASYLKAIGAQPQAVEAILQASKAGSITDAQAAASLKMSPQQWTLLKQYYTPLSPQELTAAQSSANVNSANYYQQLVKAAQANVAATSGLATATTPKAPNLLQRGVSNLNQLQRELLLSSGFTGVQNAADIYTKGMLEGISAGQMTKYMTQALGTGQVDDFVKLAGAQAPGTVARLGDVNALKQLGGPERQAILEKLSPFQAATAGGAVGAMTGNPVAALTGAVEGVLAKYGFTYGMQFMKGLETAARQGMTAFKAQTTLASEGDDIAKALAQEVGPLKGGALAQAIKDQKYLISPEAVDNLSGQMGFTADEISRAGQVWRQFHGQALEAGVQLSNSVNFAYTQPTNLIQALRSVTPFPVWPIQNLQYYGEQLVKYPGIAGFLTSYFNQAAQAQQDVSGTARLNQRIPLLDLLSGTVWGNPISPLSLAGQLQQPYPDTPGTTPTALDKVQALLSIVGLSAFPSLMLPAQALGLVDQQKSPQDVVPWTRLIRPLTQLATGTTVDPEGALKAAFSGVQQAAAPASAPDVPYQDYQVRKKLAEMSLRDTGKAWWDSTDYSLAMIDPESDLWKQATREVGVEQSLLYGARRGLPFNLAYLPAEEEKIRQAKTALGTFPQGMTGQQIGDYMRANQWAYGYKDISDSTPVLTIEVKQNVYFRLPQDSRKVYIAQNPDLKAWFDWSNAEKKAGRKPTIDDYIARQQGAKP